jgi:2-keto-3-deoxy-L-rhamnonate aldolase RhmA
VGRGGGGGGGAAAAGARAGGGGAGAAGAGAQQAPAPPPIDLAVAARETLGYKTADFQYASGSNDTFLRYVEELVKAGGTARTHAFIAKTLILNANREAATQRIHSQLNAGHVGIMMERVESAQEIKDGIAAMRFRSKGGTRPDEGIGLAARYWGMSEAEYREKADVWPLNPNGELIVWAIVESKEGIAKVREIAATPGIGVLWAGAGTLGGVYSATNPDGTRGARDEAGFNAAVASILAACKEFRVPCGYPASNPADIERLMAQGWSVFVMQGRNENGFAAVEAGRRLSGRATMP